MKESLEVAKKGLKSAARLFPVLGTPWIVGVLMITVHNNQVLCILAIVHTVLSGLQSLYMFRIIFLNLTYYENFVFKKVL